MKPLWLSNREIAAYFRPSLGRLQAKDSDAIDMLAQALTGMPKSFLASSIRNAHTASTLALEKLDPRFNISSSFDPQMGTKFLVSRKEPVDINFRSDPHALSSVTAQYLSLLDHGVGFQVDTKEIVLEGSPLISSLSEVASGGGRLLIGAKPINAVTKLALVDPVTGQHEALDDVHGDLVVGLKTCTFIGASMGGFQSLTFTKEMDSNSYFSTLNFNFNFEQWLGVDIKTLPWFSKVVKIMRAIESGWILVVTPEINGERLPGGVVILDQIVAARIVTLLKYTELARELSALLCTKIPFQYGDFMSDEGVEILAKAVETARMYSQDVEQLTQPATLEIDNVFRGNSEVIIQQPPRLESPMAAHPMPWDVNVFGLHNSMPDIVFTLDYHRQEKAVKATSSPYLFPELSFSIEYRFDIPN